MTEFKEALEAVNFCIESMETVLCERVNPENINIWSSGSTDKPHISIATLYEIKRALDIANKYQWRPIETAPKDGTHILAYLPYSGGFTMETWWHIDNRGGVWFEESGEICPTHWMPLPDFLEIKS